MSDESDERSYEAGGRGSAVHNARFEPINEQIGKYERKDDESKKIAALRKLLLAVENKTPLPAHNDAELKCCGISFGENGLYVSKVRLVVLDITFEFERQGNDDFETANKSTLLRPLDKVFVQRATLNDDNDAVFFHVPSVYINFMQDDFQDFRRYRGVDLRAGCIETIDAARGTNHNMALVSSFYMPVISDWLYCELKRSVSPDGFSLSAQVNNVQVKVDGELQEQVKQLHKTINADTLLGKSVDIKPIIAFKDGQEPVVIDLVLILGDERHGDSCRAMSVLNLAKPLAGACAETRLFANAHKLPPPGARNGSTTRRRRAAPNSEVETSAATDLRTAGYPAEMHVMEHTWMLRILYDNVVMTATRHAPKFILTGKNTDMPTRVWALRECVIIQKRGSVEWFAPDNPRLQQLHGIVPKRAGAISSVMVNGDSLVLQGTGFRYECGITRGVDSNFHDSSYHAFVVGRGDIKWLQPKAEDDSWIYRYFGESVEEVKRLLKQDSDQIKSAMGSPYTEDWEDAYAIRLYESPHEALVSMPISSADASGAQHTPQGSGLSSSDQSAHSQRPIPFVRRRRRSESLGVRSVTVQELAERLAHLEQTVAAFIPGNEIMGRFACLSRHPASSLFHVQLLEQLGACRHPLVHGDTVPAQTTVLRALPYPPGTDLELHMQRLMLACACVIGSAVGQEEACPSHIDAHALLVSAFLCAAPHALPTLSLNRNAVNSQKEWVQQRRKQFSVGDLVRVTDPLAAPGADPTHVLPEFLLRCAQPAFDLCLSVVMRDRAHPALEDLVHQVAPVANGAQLVLEARRLFDLDAQSAVLRDAVKSGALPREPLEAKSSFAPLEEAPREDDVGSAALADCMAAHWLAQSTLDPGFTLEAWLRQYTPTHLDRVWYQQLCATTAAGAIQPLEAELKINVALLEIRDAAERLKQSPERMQALRRVTQLLPACTVPRAVCESHSILCHLWYLYFDVLTPSPGRSWLLTLPLKASDARAEATLTQEVEAVYCQLAESVGTDPARDGALLSLAWREALVRFAETTEGRHVTAGEARAAWDAFVEDARVLADPASRLRAQWARRRANKVGVRPHFSVIAEEVQAGDDGAQRMPAGADGGEEWASGNAAVLVERTHPFTFIQGEDWVAACRKHGPWVGRLKKEDEVLREAEEVLHALAEVEPMPDNAEADEQDDPPPPPQQEVAAPPVRRAHRVVPNHEVQQEWQNKLNSYAIYKNSNRTSIYPEENMQFETDASHVVSILSGIGAEAGLCVASKAHQRGSKKRTCNAKCLAGRALCAEHANLCVYFPSELSFAILERVRDDVYVVCGNLNGNNSISYVPTTNRKKKFTIAKNTLQRQFTATNTKNASNPTLADLGAIRFPLVSESWVKEAARARSLRGKQHPYDVGHASELQSQAELSAVVSGSAVDAPVPGIQVTASHVAGAQALEVSVSPQAAP